jgi:hypothetical protein
MIKHISRSAISLLADLGVDVENIDGAVDLEINHFDHWANRLDVAVEPTSCSCWATPLFEVA